MKLLNNLVKPIFKQDDKGNTLYYPSIFRQGFVIDSKNKKNEIIQFYKKVSVLSFFFILTLLLGSFLCIFIFNVTPLLFIILPVSFAGHLYDKKIKKMTEGFSKIDKLKIKGISNIMAHSISLFILILLELVLIFLMSYIVSTIFRQLSTNLASFFYGIGIITILIYLSFITGKAILLQFKNK